MMFPSHLLGTLILGLVVSRGRPLSANEWLLALAFGVAIDLDHALQFPGYVLANGLSGLTPSAMFAWGASWQGFMHAAWGLLAALGFAFAFRSWVPPVFWGLHMGLDFFVAMRFVPFGSALEWALIAVASGAVAALFVLHQRWVGDARSLSTHVVHTLGLPIVAGWILRGRRRRL